MQTLTAVIEGEMIVCLHQICLTNVMVQMSSGKRRNQWNGLISDMGSLQKVGCLETFILLVL